MSILSKFANDKAFCVALGLASVISGSLIYDKISTFMKNLSTNCKSKCQKNTSNQDDMITRTKQRSDSILRQKEESDNSIPKLLKKVNFKPQNVYKICITGGPLSGKTTAMNQIAEKLREMGIRTYIVPEASTFLGTSHLDLVDTERKFKAFSAIIKYTMDLEDCFMSLANVSDKPDDFAVVLCEQGTMSTRINLSEEEWEGLLDQNGWSSVILKDKRYDGVIHLVSAADGAEEQYKNQAPVGTSIEKAKEIDHKLKNVWAGHHHYAIVDNSFSSFEEKIRAAFTTVLHMISRPQKPCKFYNEYLLQKSEDNALPQFPNDFNIENQKLTIEDIYLESAHSTCVQEKITKIAQNDQFYHMHSILIYDKDGSDNHGTQINRAITAREYLSLLDRKDKSRIAIEKIRHYFIWEGDYYFIDTYMNIGTSYSLLMTNKVKDINALPEFVRGLKNITDSKEVSPYELSKISNTKLSIFDIASK